jgi:hypothetical protein
MNLIGKKVKGFKFEDCKYNWIPYNEAMDKYIGEVGEIIKYENSLKSYTVKFFKDHYWQYPEDQIEAHLVDEWVVGEEYEFSCGDGKWDKRKLLAVLPEKFESRHRFIVQQGVDGNNWISKLQIRPIESNREVKQQIEKLEKELETLKKLL